MYAHPAHAAPRTSALVRPGVTASAVALVLAGFSTPAAAHTPEAGIATPPVTEQDGVDTTAEDTAEDEAVPDDAESQEAEAAEEPVLYEVLPGDYLASIAVENGLDPVEGWRLLFDANPEIADPDVIVPGQVLRIPSPDEQLEPRALPAPPPPAVPDGSQPTAEASPAPQQSTPEPGQAPVTQPQVNTSAPAGVWDQLAQCESGGNWAINTGNGYYGGLQFSQSSWQAVGGSGLPNEASRAEQIQRGQQLQAIQGWGAWPACSSKLGLR